MFPSQFVDGQFNIPESGNGVPDILDEARWELEWMLKMQDKESGGFYPRVQSDNDENIKSRIIRIRTAVPLMILHVPPEYLLMHT